MNNFYLAGNNEILKSVNLNALPEEAFNIIVGKEEADSDNIWQKVGILYRCIEICQNEMGNIPFNILNQTTGNVVWNSEDKQIPKGYEWFNDLNDLFGLSEAALLISSRAFWHKETVGNTLKDLRWLAPKSVKPKWDKTTGLIGFTRNVNGTSIDFTIEEIVPFMKLNPMTETEFIASPVDACTNSALVLYALDHFLKTFIDRGLAKATILTVDGNPSQKEKEELKSFWNRIFSGIKNAFSTAVLTSNVKPLIIGEGLKDLENDILIKSKKEDIVSTMGIPLSMVLSNAANYATSLVDKKNFYDNRMLPDARFVATQANKYLFDEIDLYVEFVPESLSLFQEDEAQRAKAFSDYVAAGMKQSVAASVLGIDLPHDIDYADLDTLVGLDQNKSYEIKAKYDGLDKQRTKIEKQGADLINEAFGKIVNAIVSPTGTINDLTVDLALQRYNEASALYLRDALDKFLHIALELGINEGVRLIEELIGVNQKAKADITGVDWTLVNQDALSWLHEHIDILLQHLDQTSAVIVQNQVSNWINNGLPLSTLKDNLIRYGFSENRAESIAVTEVTRVYAEGNRQSFNHAPFPVAMQWNTAVDEVVCQICRPLNGSVKNIDGSFFDDLPDDVKEKLSNRTFEVMPAHVRCRCWLSPVVL